ncbi:MAG: YHS domain-containing protein [Armatimonadota bacterium]
MPEDPVCGMQVSADTPYKVETEDGTYYFCSRECAQEFIENSEDYLSPMNESFNE